MHGRDCKQRTLQFCLALDTLASIAFVIAARMAFPFGPGTTLFC